MFLQYTNTNYATDTRLELMWPFQMRNVTSTIGAAKVLTSTWESAVLEHDNRELDSLCTSKIKILNSVYQIFKMGWDACVQIVNKLIILKMNILFVLPHDITRIILQMEKMQIQSLFSSLWFILGDLCTTLDNQTLKNLVFHASNLELGTWKMVVP